MLPLLVFFSFIDPAFYFLISREKYKHSIRRMIFVFLRGKVKYGFHEKLKDDGKRLSLSFRKLRWRKATRLRRNFPFNSPLNLLFELFCYCTERLLGYLCLFILSPCFVSFCFCFCDFADLFNFFFSSILYLFIFTLALLRKHSFIN